MSDFRPGDVAINIDGNAVHLRLSMGALAAIAARLDARSPQAMAARFREAATIEATIATVLDCTKIDESVPYENTPLAKAVSQLFETAFSDGLTQDRGDAWPFDAWLKMAVYRFGLSPGEFWQMSMRDWRVLTGMDKADHLTRNDFEALAKNHPDTESYHYE